MYLELKHFLNTIDTLRPMSYGDCTYLCVLVTVQKCIFCLRLDLMQYNLVTIVRVLSAKFLHQE